MKLRVILATLATLALMTSIGSAQSTLPLGQRLIGPDFPVDDPVLDPVAEAFGAAQQTGTPEAWDHFFRRYGGASDNPYVQIAVRIAEHLPTDTLAPQPLPGMAFNLLAPLAEGGDPVAQYYFGRMQHMRTDPAPDWVTAHRWYRLAAEAGYAAAQTNLAATLNAGLGVEQDRLEAIHWLIRAAQQNDRNALFGLAEILEDLLPADRLDLVAELYYWSALLDYAPAQYAAGQMYLAGRGVPIDVGEAAALLSRAATLGHAPSQYEYAILLLDGRGVAADPAGGRLWLQKAADSGFAPARDALAALAAPPPGPARKRLAGSRVRVPA